MARRARIVEAPSKFAPTAFKPTVAPKRERELPITFKAKQQVAVKMPKGGTPVYETREMTVRPKPDAPCEVPKKGGVRALRGCHLELTFTGDSAVLRACTTVGEPGILIPVKDAADARAKGLTFCACRKRSAPETCAKQLGGGTLGRSRRRR